MSYCQLKTVTMQLSVTSLVNNTSKLLHISQVVVMTKQVAKYLEECIFKYESNSNTFLDNKHDKYGREHDFIFFCKDKA